MNRQIFLLALPAMLLVLLFALVMFSFGEISLLHMKPGSALFSGPPSLTNYTRVLHSAGAWRAVWTTLRLSLTITLLCVLMGYPLALLLARSTSARLRRFILFSLIATFLSGGVTRAYAWMLILGNRGVINQTLSLLHLPSVPLINNETGVVIAVLNFVLPVIVLYAFSSNNYRIISAQGFTLEWFVNFFTNDRFNAALLNSLGIALITTVVTMLVALPTAIVAVRHRFAGRDLLLTLISAPLVIPGVIIGTAALGFVSQSGVGPGFWPITVAMICLTLPLAMRPLIANLSGLDPALENAARNLGARPIGAFMRITLPQLTPGMIAGGTFAFVEAMDNFAVAAFLTSIDTTTLPVESYSYIRDIDDPTVAAMATLLIAFSVLLVFVIEKLLGLDKFLDVG